MGDQRYDSLDEFPPESLDLYVSTPSDDTPGPAGLIAIVPAPPVSDNTSADAASGVWQRRRRSRFRRAIRAATPQTPVRLRLKIPSVGAGLRDVAAHALLPLRRSDLPAARRAPASEPSTLVRERRRARIRRTINEAAGRDSLTRVATLSQLTPVLGRVVAAASARSARQVRRAVKPVAATARALALGARNATARAAVATAAQARRATATSVLLARQLPGAARPLVAKAQTATANVRSRAPQAMAAARLAARMLHPRSVAVAVAMLALIVIAGPDNGLSDMSARRRAVPAPATTAATVIEPAVPAPVSVEPRPVSSTAAATVSASSAAPTASAPAESAPAASASVTSVASAPVASAPAASASAAAPATKRPSVRADPRAIQAVLNRYRDAISTLDFAAVRAVWPSADIEALRKEFAGVRDQNVEFEACRISSIDAGASALCAGVVESGFRPGDRRPRVERRRWEFTLRRFGAGWQITDVHSPRG
jgi:hypothetical protein